MTTFKSYLTGFILSIALTFAAYFAVMGHIRYGILIILILAIAQLFVQSVFFLHLNQGNDRVWNIALYFSALGIIFILVVGSLWIMNHLNYNMMADQEIIQDEGIHK